MERRRVIDVEVTERVQFRHIDTGIWQRRGRGLGDESHRRRLTLVAGLVGERFGRERHIHRSRLELAGERIPVKVATAFLFNRRAEHHIGDGRPAERKLGRAIGDCLRIQLRGCDRLESNRQVSTGVQRREIDGTAVRGIRQAGGRHSHLERFLRRRIRIALFVGESTRLENNLILAGWQC